MGRLTVDGPRREMVAGLAAGVLALAGLVAAVTVETDRGAPVGGWSGACVELGSANTTLSEANCGGYHEGVVAAVVDTSAACPEITVVVVDVVGGAACVAPPLGRFTLTD